MISATGEAKISVRKKGDNWMHGTVFKVSGILELVSTGVVVPDQQIKELYVVR